MLPAYFVILKMRLRSICSLNAIILELYGATFVSLEIFQRQGMIEGERLAGPLVNSGERINLSRHGLLHLSVKNLPDNFQDAILAPKDY